MIEYNSDIAWLIQEADGSLGVGAIDYRNVQTGNRTVADNGPQHDRAISALGAAGRARELGSIWSGLDRGTQLVLAGRYAQKPWPFGFKGVFGELAGVVLAICDDEETVRGWCSFVHKHRSELQKLEKQAVRACSAAHRAWEQERRLVMVRWAEGAA